MDRDDVRPPEVVQDAVESQAVGPAGGEVEHVDARVGARALTHPAQQDLLAVGLLQVGHDVLHDVLHLADGNVERRTRVWI